MHGQMVNVRYCYHFKVCLQLHLLAFHISIFFSQTSRSIETKQGRNVSSVILNILYFFMSAPGLYINIFFNLSLRTTN